MLDRNYLFVTIQYWNEKKQTTVKDNAGGDNVSFNETLTFRIPPARDRTAHKRAEWLKQLNAGQKRARDKARRNFYYLLTCFTSC